MNGAKSQEWEFLASFGPKRVREKREHKTKKIQKRVVLFAGQDDI